MGIERAYVDVLDSEGVQQRRLDGHGNLSIDQSELLAPKPLCVGFSEIDRYASSVLTYKFPNIKNYGDITKIGWKDVPDFDILVGGSPCQDFSVAGKRAGIEGSRSGLFSCYIQALEEKQPAYFIWENVKGVLSSNGGRDFAYILNQMAEAGYSLWWQVLNAKDFGVPQNRERIFVVGTRSDIGSPREVFFERSTKGENSKPISSRTLRAHDGGTSEYDTFIKSGAKVRRLSPKECERLMAWPDDWTKYGAERGSSDGSRQFRGYDSEGREMIEISDTQRYKMCGNGVVSEVVAEVYKAHFL